MVDEFLKVVGEKSSSNEEGRLVWNGGEETLYILDKTHSQNIRHFPVDSYKETFNLQLNEGDIITREYNLTQDDTGIATLRKIKLQDVTQSQIIFESYVQYTNNKIQKGIYTFKKHPDGYFFINDEGKEIITDLGNSDPIDIDFYIPYLSYPFYVGIQTKVTANNPRIIFTNIDLTKNNKTIYNSISILDPSVTKICGSAHLKVGNFVYCFTLIQENFKTNPYKYSLMYFTNEAIPKLKKKEIYATHNTSLSLSQVEESSYALITRIAKLGQGSELHFEKFRVRETSLAKFGTILTAEKIKADVPFEMSNILTYTPVINGHIYLTNKAYVVPVNNQFYDVKQIDSPPPFDVAISPLGHYIISHPFVQKGKTPTFYETKEFEIKLKEDGTTIIIEKKNFLTLKKYAFERNLGIFEAGKKQIIYHYSDKECANPIYFTVPDSAESLISILSVNYNLVGGDTFYFVEKDGNGEEIRNLKYLFDDLSGKFVNVMNWEKGKVTEINNTVNQTTNIINNTITPNIQQNKEDIGELKNIIEDLENKVTESEQQQFLLKKEINSLIDYTKKPLPHIRYNFYLNSPPPWELYKDKEGHNLTKKWEWYPISPLIKWNDTYPLSYFTSPLKIDYRYTNISTKDNDIFHPLMTSFIYLPEQDTRIVYYTWYFSTNLIYPWQFTSTWGISFENAINVLQNLYSFFIQYLKQKYPNFILENQLLIKRTKLFYNPNVSYDIPFFLWRLSREENKKNYYVYSLNVTFPFFIKEEGVKFLKEGVFKEEDFNVFKSKIKEIDNQSLFAEEIYQSYICKFYNYS